MYSENTQARMALFNNDEKQELFYALEASLPPDEISSAAKLKKLEKKYFDLVWFARSRPENANIPGVKANKDRIIADYPKEVAELRGANDNWQHGFNSGILACTRLLRAYALPRNHREVMEDSLDGDSSDEEQEGGFVMTKQSEIEQAEEDFPMLDT